MTLELLAILAQQLRNHPVENLSKIEIQLAVLLPAIIDELQAARDWHNGGSEDWILAAKRRAYREARAALDVLVPGEGTP